MHMSRREFVSACAAAGIRPATAREEGFRGIYCLFSKHFPESEPGVVAREAAKAGFGGIDLTVRAGGHVPPGRAGTDLPRAVTDIRGEGLDVPMITTDLVSATGPARGVLSTAGSLKIPYFKPGYYYYKFVDVRAELESAGRDFRSLVEVARESGVQAGYHNHAGYIGAPIWDIASVIETLDPRWAGYYFDACHAVTEGGVAGWRVAALRFAPRFKMVAIKDFFWEKTPARGWQPRICPLGEGMVDWKEFFKILASVGFAGPVSLHLEYEIPGKTAAEKSANTWAAAKRDLAALKRFVEEAYA